MTQPGPQILDGLFDGELASGLSLLSELELQGLDPIDLLSPLLEADERTDQSTRPDAQLSGESDSLRISLPPEAEQRLVREWCDLLTDYDLAVRDRIERDDEIADSYALIPEPSQGGSGTDSAQMSSEMTMALIDQAHARIVTGVFGVTPLTRVDAVETYGFEGEEARATARSAEQWLQAYSMDGPPDLRYNLPVALLRTVKVGTSVFFVEWEDVKKRRRFYPPAPPAQSDPTSPRRQVRPVETVERVGQIKVRLVPNRDVKIWPPTVINWQDATFVGHEATHTPESWRSLARRYNLSPEVVDRVLSNPNETLDPLVADLRRQGIESGTLLDRKELEPIVLTQLWGSIVLPGDDDPTAVQIILHRPTYTLIWLGHNPHFSETKPYFPIRYKWSDESAFGSGVGHELLDSQAADSAMLCLELDNLMAGAYHVILRRPGSIYNTQTEDLRPGAQLIVDDVNEDFRSVKVGGDAEELTLSRGTIYQRARAATGISAVSMGQGDPVMKSGAGTGSVLALIDQGDKKLKQIDSNLRTDLTKLYAFFLELAAQYAPDGLFYRWASEEDANRLKVLKFTPPRGGELSQMFRLRVQAPSLGSSDEARKDRIMLIGNLAVQHVQVIDAYVTDLLTQHNPAALPRWKESVIKYLTAIHLETVRLHEIPGIPELVPEMPEMTSQDEQMNELAQENSTLQGQVQQLQAQLQQLATEGMGMVGGGALQPGQVEGEMNGAPGSMPMEADPMMAGADPMAMMAGAPQGDPNVVA